MFAGADCMHGMHMVHPEPDWVGTGMGDLGKGAAVMPLPFCPWRAGPIRRHVFCFAAGNIESCVPFWRICCKAKARRGSSEAEQRRGGTAVSASGGPVGGGWRVRAYCSVLASMTHSRGPEGVGGCARIRVSGLACVYGGVGVGAVYIAKATQYMAGVRVLGTCSDMGAVPRETCILVARDQRGRRVKQS